MNDVIIRLIDKMPAGYVMVLIPVLLAAAVWVFTRIRRDKQGKMYWYSPKYEDLKRNRKQDKILTEVSKLTTDMVEMKEFRETAVEALQDIKKDSVENRKDILQLQICSVHLPPIAKQTAYREYKKLGLNSWVDEYVAEKGICTPEEMKYIRGAAGGRSEA
jgi:hypothetical protein